MIRLNKENINPVFECSVVIFLDIEKSSRELVNQGRKS